MSGPTRMDSSRVFAKWVRQRHLAQQYKSRHLATSVRVRGRSPQKLHSDLHPSRSRQRFHRIQNVIKSTLGQIAPVLNGAFRVFLPSHARVACIRASSRELASFSTRRTPSSRLAAFAMKRVHLPRGPGLHVSTCHGPGLQSARAFSSGGAGARLFENMITDAPLAIRAFGNKFKDEAHVRESKSLRREARAAKTQLKAVRGVMPLNHYGLASLCAMEPAALTDLDSVNTDDMELFFPLAKTSSACAGPFQGVKTVLTVALDPYTPMIDGKSEVFCSQNMPQVSASLLDENMQLKLHQIQARYKHHHECIKLLEAVLRYHNMWPSKLDMSCVEVPIVSNKPVFLRIKIPGWRKPDVEAALRDVPKHVIHLHSHPLDCLWSLMEIS